MTSAQELVAQTAANVGSLGAKYYFHPNTLAVGKELGLDGFRFYVLGRGGVLGDVEPAVVTSAFGYFNPGTIAKIWTSGCEKVAPRDAARAALGANAELGRETLGGAAGLAEFCAAAEQVVADVNPAGLSMYAGIAAEPLPEDLPAPRDAADLRAPRASWKCAPRRHHRGRNPSFGRPCNPPAQRHPDLRLDRGDRHHR